MTAKFRLPRCLDLCEYNARSLIEVPGILLLFEHDSSSVVWKQPASLEFANVVHSIDMICARQLLSDSTRASITPKVTRFEKGHLLLLAPAKLDCIQAYCRLILASFFFPAVSTPTLAQPKVELPLRDYRTRQRYANTELVHARSLTY